MSSKVLELLLSAGREAVAAEKEKLVSQAVSLALPVVGHTQLDVLVSHLSTCGAFTSIVELCIAAAQARALQFYKAGQPKEAESGGRALYAARSEAYSHCTSLLATLLSCASQAQASSSAPSLPLTPGPPSPLKPAPPSSGLSPETAAAGADQVFSLITASPDELAHVHLFEWMVNNAYTERLLATKSPFLEEFLKACILQHPNRLAMFDLLWKFYKKREEYVATAKILAKLSECHSTELGLRERVAYLSRAVTCVKSSKGAASTGELLQHLEEKMGRWGFFRLSGRVVGLRWGGWRLSWWTSPRSTRTQEWAEPLHLWESQLAILACAGHPDPLFISSI